MISLYVKTHNKTGLNYLGKTTKDPLKYKGSGKWWKRHIEKHGNDVTTIVVSQFECEDECNNFALILSRDLNIVDSERWANLIVENGKDGAPVGHDGHSFTDEQREKMSTSSKERWSNPEYKSRMSEIHKARWMLVDKESLSVALSESWTDKRKTNQSSRLKEMYANSPDKRIAASKRFSELVRTDEHRGKISAALKGKVKSIDSRINLAFQKIKQNNPDCKYESYFDLWSESARLFSNGCSISDVSRSLKIGWTAAKMLSLNKYNLKEK